MRAREIEQSDAVLDLLFIRASLPVPVKQGEGLYRCFRRNQHLVVGGL